MGDRLFTEDELAEMGRPTLSRLLDAIDAGDLDAAREHAERFGREAQAMHDLYRNKAASLQSYVYERFGDAALEEALTESARHWWLPILERMPRGRSGLKRRIKMFVAGLRGHLQPITVREEDDRVVVQMHPCGSGGRLVLEGAYDGPEGLASVAEPQRVTFGRADYPVYCAHEAPMEVLDIEVHGSPMVVVEPSADLGHEPCTFLIHKDASSVPDRYFDRLGLDRTALDRTAMDCPPGSGEGAGQHREKEAW